MAYTLVTLLAAQALLGLLCVGAYRDAAWVTASWFGNDIVTLFIGVPLLLCGHTLAARGSRRGRLLELGVTAYAGYNAAFYLFGAVLNAFFPLYVGIFLLSGVTLFLSLAHTDAGAVGASFMAGLPVRFVGGGLVIIGASLATVWIAMWGAHVFAGWPTPLEPDAFRLVAALDLTLLVPGLIAGGVLLWRRRPWGYVLAPIASIQAALYLAVLSVNSVVAIRRGLTTSPGELPIWGALALVTSAFATILLTNTNRGAINNKLASC